jgi:hypothetical protein
VLRQLIRCTAVRVSPCRLAKMVESLLRWQRGIRGAQHDHQRVQSVQRHALEYEIQAFWLLAWLEPDAELPERQMPASLFDFLTYDDAVSN